MDENPNIIRIFVYGSNMDKADLDKWCHKQKLPKIQYLNITPAKIKGYKLAFNYFSHSRNGGAANIMEAKGISVYGLLVEIKESELKIIRKKEGYPNYYNETLVEVETFDGKLVKNVRTYKVVKEKEEKCHQKPTDEYLSLIIRNAIKYDFPGDYINFLRSFEKAV